MPTKKTFARGAKIRFDVWRMLKGPFLPMKVNYVFKCNIQLHGFMITFGPPSTMLKEGKFFEAPNILQDLP